MRGSYSGNTLAFQAKADSSILLPRSKIFDNKQNIVYNKTYADNSAMFFKTVKIFATVAE